MIKVKKNLYKFSIVFIVIFSILIIIMIWSYFEKKNYKITKYEIDNSKNEGTCRIVYISDFHNKNISEFDSSFYDDIIKLKPDYIIFGGDFIDFSSTKSYFGVANYEETIKFLKEFSAIVDENFGRLDNGLSRIFYGYGNHELRLKSRDDNENLVKIYNELEKAIDDVGINKLDDKMYDFNNGFTISGLNLYDGYYTNANTMVPPKAHIEKEILTKNFPILDEKKYNMMIFHKPDYAKDFFDYGFDMMIAGHTHGGLIRFPFIGALISTDLKFLPKYDYGNFDIDGKTLIISSGIGDHFPKIRINNRPEIVVVDIK